MGPFSLPNGHFFSNQLSVLSIYIVVLGLGNIDSLMLEVRTSWYIECLLPNVKMLTSLDLKGIQYRDPLNTHMIRSSFIHFESIKEIILVCEELMEANFQNQCRIEDDLDFFANNLTTKIEKLNISQIGILDEHMVKLLNRCKNITELDLHSRLICLGGVPVL